MTELSDLGKPTDFWEYFKKISKIPHCSGKEEKVRVFIKNEAEKMGFETKTDKVGNLVVRIPSKSKEHIKIVLQSHMDMVCEKNEEIKHDFSKDPIKLEIIDINGDKWITAKGTTLGADNGAGIAYQLTLMKYIKNGKLNFGSLSIDLLFTVNEEMGLVGATQIDYDLINYGNYLINLDSEKDDRFTIGCAGGNSFTVEIKTKRIDVNQVNDYLTPIKISVTGLMGGHSGVDIHLGRANAVKIISRILWKLNEKYLFYLNSINGGKIANAIPREAWTTLYVKKEDLFEINAFIKDLASDIIKFFDDIEPNLLISFKELERITDTTGLIKENQDKLLNILYSIPNGPVSMHPKLKDLVRTSTNLASIQTRKNRIQFRISQRSLTSYGLRSIHEKFKALLKLAGSEIITKNYAEYPSWPPNFNSKISKISQKTYKDLFDEELIIQIIHAGLECAILKKHFPEMEMISIGPMIMFPHSPDERLNIKSIEKIWNFLIELLYNLI